METLQKKKQQQQQQRQKYTNPEGNNIAASSL